MKILFTGGGTGGHIMPIVAIGRELRGLYRGDDLVLYYIGPKDKYSLPLLSQENFKVHTILSGKIRRYFSFQNIADILFKLPIGFIQSFFLLLFIRPKLVFSKGGSGSIMVCFSARILRIPVFLHESDSAPGLSNRKVYKFAKKVFISFPKTAYFDLSKAIATGNPIKKEIMDGNLESAAEIFNLTLQKKVILFWGGSQGARAINDFIMLIINDLLKKYEVIHITGHQNYGTVLIESDMMTRSELKKYYHMRESLSETELKHALKAVNLIVSRAGAGSIFEIAACGKPSILIPLPSAASNHQSKNAYQYSDTGAAIVIEQENLTPNFFLVKIYSLISNKEEMEKMKNAALQFAKPAAARKIAEEILEYLKS